MARKIATTTTTKNGNVKVEGYKPMNGGKWITKERRLAIYLRDGFICNYCGCDLKNIAVPQDMALDHLTPRSAGGSNDSTNLVTVCRSCNSKRSDKPWLDYAVGGAVDRINTNRYKAINLALAKALIKGDAKDEQSENER